MNKRGQTLVALIVILPLILLALGSIIEYSVIEYNKKRIESVTKTIIASEIETKNEDNIKELYKNNNINGNIEVIKDNGLEIKIETTIDSFLGSIINKDKYDLKIDIKGIKENNTIKYKKGA